MGKNKYYLGLIDRNTPSPYEIDDILDNTSEFKNLTHEQLQNLLIQFHCEIPSLDGVSTYSDSIYDKNVLNFKSLSSLIDEYLYNIDFDFNDYEEDDEDKIEERFEKLLTDFIIIKENVNLGRFSVVDDSTIINCYKQLMDNIDNELAYNSEQYVLNIDKTGFDKMLDNLMIKIENYIEFEHCQVSMIVDNSNYYMFSIVKANSPTHLEMLKTVDEEGLVPDPNSRGFVYDCNYYDFKDFVEHNLKLGKPLSCTASTILAPSSETDFKKVFLKAYGFWIGFHEDGIHVQQLTAKDVSTGNPYNPQTGEIINSKRNIIYCGFEKDDIVMGFDLE